MRGRLLERLEPKDTVERFWGLKFIGFPNRNPKTNDTTTPPPVFLFFFSKILLRDYI